VRKALGEIRRILRPVIGLFAVVFGASLGPQPRHLGCEVTHPLGGIGPFAAGRIGFREWDRHRGLLADLFLETQDWVCGCYRVGELCTALLPSIHDPPEVHRTRYDLVVQ
jgi:hypothetical protein